MPTKHVYVSLPYGSSSSQESCFDLSHVCLLSDSQRDVRRWLKTFPSEIIIESYAGILGAERCSRRSACFTTAVVSRTVLILCKNRRQKPEAEEEPTGKRSRKARRRDHWQPLAYPYMALRRLPDYHSQTAVDTCDRLLLDRR